VSERISRSTLLAISALFSFLYAATHDFLPDHVFRESSLAGMKTMGHAGWHAANGEITATPQNGEGGWLLLDKSYQDIHFYAEFRCAAQCDAEIGRAHV